MKVIIDDRVEKGLSGFTDNERSHIKGVIELFQEKGFYLTEKHLKKLTKTLWELRSSNTRVLFGIINSIAVIVNIFKKKTNKTPMREIQLAKRRLNQYI